MKPAADTSQISWKEKRERADRSTVWSRSW